jgi:hypothetical protein
VIARSLTNAHRTGVLYRRSEKGTAAKYISGRLPLNAVKNIHDRHCGGLSDHDGLEVSPDRRFIPPLKIGNNEVFFAFEVAIESRSSDIEMRNNRGDTDGVGAAAVK